MLSAILIVFGSYLIGSVPVAYLTGRILPVRRLENQNLMKRHNRIAYDDGSRQ